MKNNRKRSVMAIVAMMLMLTVAPLKARSADTLQVSLLDVADTTNVVWDRNGLEFPGGHDRFDRMYRKLTASARTADGRFHVLHIGGSHVQASIFSGRMRRNMAAFNNGCPVGRGMAFPFSLIGTNGSRDISCEATGTWTRTRCIEAKHSVALGLTGAAATTSDTIATLRLTFQKPLESLLLLGASSGENTVSPVLVVASDTLYPFPSSKAEGYEFRLSRPLDTFNFVFEHEGEASFTFRGLYPDFDSPGLVYSESGVNGAAVPSWLRCEKLQDELNLLVPDLVVFGIGINDANVKPEKFDSEVFKRNYRKLISRIRKSNPNCEFIFVTNNDSQLRSGGKSRGFNTNGPKVEQAFSDLAKEYQGAVWNLFQVMGGLRSSAGWVKAGLMRPDYVHFTAEGYNLIGDLLYNAIVADYLGLDVYAPTVVENP